MVIKNVVNSETLKNLENCFNNEKITTVEEQVKGSIGHYNLECTKHLLDFFKKIIEETFEIQVKPQTTYMRKMFKGQDLKEHVDKLNMNVTVSLLINKPDDGLVNPLIMHTDPKQYLELEVGDCAIMIDGHKIKHSRPTLESDWMLLLFLHYSYSNNNDVKKITKTLI